MHKLSCFMSGLKDEIRLAVKMQNPRSLGAAYSLAKIQEEYLFTMKRSSRPSFEPTRSTWGQTSSQQATHAKSDLKPSHPKPPVAVHRLTPMQMSERRRKGLCYHCDEKWSLGHKCKSPLKLYSMEEVAEEEEDIEAGTEQGEVELEEEQGEITLCALLGNSSPSTMRVVAILSGHKTVVLLDTGSTHNFMDSGLAVSLKLEVDATNRFGVRVANGQVIRTKGECKEVKFIIQGLHMKVNFNLLELGGCGIVLGTQWLSTLGMISWDFKKLCMGFLYEGKQVWLQGLKESKSLIQGNKECKGRGVVKGLLLQIMSAELTIIQEGGETPMQELLDTFPKIFRNLKGCLLIGVMRIRFCSRKECHPIVKDHIGTSTIKRLKLRRL